MPDGNEIWSTIVEGPVGDDVRLQQGLVRQIIGAVAPNLDPDPIYGPRAEAGGCSDVYDLYLRGKQLSRGLENRERGVELLREAVAIDDQCAIAWEAIALASVNWTMSGFAKAGAAARRALELNDSLPEAYRYEPIYDFHVSLAAAMAGNGELTLKHARLMGKKYDSSSFFALFYPDAGVLRQRPRFAKLVTETGLLEYWQKWGWSDYCEPDGDEV